MVYKPKKKSLGGPSRRDSTLDFPPAELRQELRRNVDGRARWNDRWNADVISSRLGLGLPWHCPCVFFLIFNRDVLCSRNDLLIGL